MWDVITCTFMYGIIVGFVCMHVLNLFFTFQHTCNCTMCWKWHNNTSTKIILDLTRLWVVILFSYSKSWSVSSTRSKVQKIFNLPTVDHFWTCQFKLLYYANQMANPSFLFWEKFVLKNFVLKNFHDFVNIFLWVWQTMHRETSAVIRSPYAWCTDSVVAVKQAS